MSEAGPTHKLDIFAALAAVDKHDLGWLDRQPEESRKGLAPPVFLRWASAIAGDGIAAEFTLCMLNERANIGANEIMGQYPDLLFRLAASCGTGTKQRHEWLPLAGRRRPAANKARDLIARHHPFASEREIDMLLGLYTKESFRDFANGAGLTPADLKECIAAYDKLAKSAARDGSDPAPKARTRKAKA